MRKLRWLSALLPLLLAACGGNSNDCSSPSFATSCGTTTPPVTVTSLTLLTSLAQVPSDGSKTATITALARDANNNVMPAILVSFQASSGAITPTQPTTDANGMALATVDSGTDPTNRTITVTASAGGATATVPVSVNGTTLALSGPSNLVLNNTGNYSVVLTNSSGQGIVGATVTLTSANGNTLTPASPTTDASGRMNFTATATAGGTDTITAAALGLTQTLALSVSTQSFNITAPADGTHVALGASQTVTVTWLNNGVPVAGQPVRFAATRGTLSPLTAVTTDSTGKASVSISSTSAGPSVVSASGTGVSAQVGLDFVANAPSQISVQAGPASVGVQGQSSITALVRDASNNLVEGATVNFQLTADPTNGGLSAASAVTNAQGSAQTVYTAGNSSSGANGVVIAATVQGTAYTATTHVTVGGQTVFLSMGTGNTIDTGQGPAVYQVVYTIFAVDSGGAPLPNAPVTMKILPVAYGKGVLGGCASGGTYWTPVYSTLPTDTYAYNNAPLCRNEDTDYTGNINSLGVIGGIPVKDYNANAKLDPGNVAVVSPSSGSTDSNGRLDVSITYPRDHAYWVKVTLVASTTVQGTESSTSSTFVLEGAIADYACAVGPPGPVSPYGVATTCADPN
jgi:Bacterial Ig-like domain (group 1)